MAHRLNLVTSQAADSVPYLKTMQKTMTSLFKFFKQSSARVNALTAMQKVMELPEIKLKEVYDVRWLAFKNALLAVFKSWPALMKMFEEKKRPMTET